MGNSHCVAFVPENNPANDSLGMGLTPWESRPLVARDMYECAHLRQSIVAGGGVPQYSNSWVRGDDLIT